MPAHRKPDHQRKSKRLQELPSAARELSRRIQEALARAGLTQVEAARLAGVSRDVVHKAVHRGSMPRDARDRDLVAKALGTNSTTLWFGKEDLAPPPASVATYRPDPKMFHVIIQHDGFSPMAVKGDTLVVTPSYPPRPGDRIYIKLKTGQEGVGFLVEDGEDKLIFVTHNGMQQAFPKKSVQSISLISSNIHRG